MDMEKIKEAVEIVQRGMAKRIDIDSNIAVYAVPPKLIRIDIKQDK